MEVDEDDLSVHPDTLSLAGLSIREQSLEDAPQHEFHRCDSWDAELFFENFLARDPSLSNPVPPWRCPDPEDRALEDARALDILDLDLDEELTLEHLYYDYEEKIDTRIPCVVAASETYFCPINTEDSVPEPVVKRMPYLHPYCANYTLCGYAFSANNKME